MRPALLAANLTTLLNWKIFKRRYVLRIAAALITLLIVLQPGLTRAAGILEQVVQTKVLTAGVRSDAFPFSFRNEQGNYDGYSIDLLRLIQQHLSKSKNHPIDLQFVEVGSDGLKRLVQGDVDISCGSISYTRNRALDVDFSVGYFLTGTQLLVKQDEQVNNEFRIGVLQGTTNADIVKRLLPLAQFVELSDRSAGMAALEQGWIDALASDGILLEGLRQETSDPSQFEVMPDQPYDEQIYGCILPQGNEPFRQIVNTTLVEFMQGLLNQDQTAQSLFDRWFGQSGVLIDRERVFAFFQQTVNTFARTPSNSPQSSSFLPRLNFSIFSNRP
ncbi:MAG TPA: amino acid ABC transporter substrate-binding protein [Trichocoleus sp.]|jgi:polar amino acid transport system substrate-binding protein